MPRLRLADWPLMRVVVLLKRIAEAIEESNRIALRRLSLEYPTLEEAKAVRQAIFSRRMKRVATGEFREPYGHSGKS